jgi:hypothetical protein
MPTSVRLADRGFGRIVAIEPIIDAPPSVTLTSPARDTVLRNARGSIPLAADISDDFGIATAQFEYIVSSGEGETFKFRSGVLGVTRESGTRASLSGALRLDALALAPGDIVHVRAVATDANDATGPGKGVSETRTIRIARPSEYDSTTVTAAAPSDAESGALSERMLIMLTEALDQARPRLARDSVLTESRSIATDQRRLRRAVGDIVFTRLGGVSGEEHTDVDAPARASTMQEMLARADSATNRSIDLTDFAGGESPVVAVNKPLLEAYNAMWDATTQLELGAPDQALPHMRTALAAIQRSRQAERLYLRSGSPAFVVDVAKARLQGKEKGASSTRSAIAPIDSARHARTERFLRVLEFVNADRAAAVDSLLLLRIDALGSEPAFAAALGDAANALRRGRADAARDALVRARRALAGPTVVRESLARWGAVP